MQFMRGNSWWGKMESLDLRHFTTMHELPVRMRRGVAMIVVYAVDLSFKVKVASGRRAICKFSLRGYISRAVSILGCSSSLTCNSV